jgi:glycine cleavage system aminomethyltransferase T
LTFCAESDFIGREALLKAKAQPLTRRLVNFTLDDAKAYPLGTCCVASICVPLDCLITCRCRFGLQVVNRFFAMAWWWDTCHRLVLVRILPISAVVSIVDASFALSGYTIGRAVAMGYVTAKAGASLDKQALEKSRFVLVINGKNYSAKALLTPPFDPKSERVRA